MSEKRKYRTFTPEQKLEIVLAGIRGGRTVRDVCREAGIAETLYYQWRPITPSDSVVCLHAPLQSRANLLRRVATNGRVENEDFGEGTAWQPRRWVRLDAEELEVERRVNSYEGSPSTCTARAPADRRHTAARHNCSVLLARGSCARVTCVASARLSCAPTLTFWGERPASE